MSDVAEVVVGIGGIADADELDELVVALADELADLPVANVERRQELRHAVPGERGGVMSFTSEIVVTLATVIGAAGGVVEIVKTLREWRSRQPDQPTVTIAIGTVVVNIDGETDLGSLSDGFPNS